MTLEQIQARRDYARSYMKEQRRLYPAKIRQLKREEYRRNRDKYIKYNQDKAARNRDLIHKAKEIPCMDCGLSFPWYVMEFDHVRGVKRGNVGGMVALDLKNLQMELAKCDVVCANCHNIRTYKRGQWGNKVTTELMR